MGTRALAAVKYQGNNNDKTAIYKAYYSRGGRNVDIGPYKHSVHMSEGASHGFWLSANSTTRTRPDRTRPDPSRPDIYCDQGPIFTDS